jgi:hypothetical protein
VLRILQDLAGGPRLDDAPAVHHHEVLGTLRGEAEVVRDEDDRGVALGREALEVIEDDLLHRHVERARRLVGDQELRMRRQADADEHALAHTPRELVGELPQPLIGIREPRILEHLDGALAHLAARGREPVGPDGLLHLEPDAVHGVERVHRVLGNETDLAPAQGLHLVALELREVATLEQHLAARDASAAGEQVDDRVRGRRLARPRFAHDGDRLARVHVEAHAAHGRHDAVLRLERDLEVLDLEQGFECAHRVALAFGSSASRTVSPSMMKASTVSDSAIEG